ncbi:MAG: hypothetical protein M1830_002569 [Pleopsidium flavum]|nr:MAG: hypothetical protein M1830_002569 [Pleopsidium flavum]
MSSGSEKIAYSVQAIKLVHGSEYFLVVEEATQCSMYQLTQAGQNRIRPLLEQIQLPQEPISESLRLLEAIGKSTVGELQSLLGPRTRKRSGLHKKCLLLSAFSLQGRYRITKLKPKKRVIWLKRSRIRGEDLAATVSIDVLADDLACQSTYMEALVSRPFRWSDKHDALLLLAHEPYDVGSIERHLEFYQLLVCSSEWIEFRLEQLLRTGKDNQDVRHL